MYKSAEIVHWMKNKETHAILPAHIDIDLTNICNQDCFYCNSAEHRRASPVQKRYTEYIDLLNKLATWREYTPKSFGTLHTITFPGGGEPTLLPGYEHVLEHTIDLGFNQPYHKRHSITGIDQQCVCGKSTSNGLDWN
jgi:sulfatase maturation enzyme AslB (radical SAM superfamily)